MNKNNVKCISFAIKTVAQEELNISKAYNGDSFSLTYLSLQ
jgi:hypothetical protein